jgi:hypothetical protein
VQIYPQRLAGAGSVRRLRRCDNSRHAPGNSATSRQGRDLPLSTVHTWSSHLGLSRITVSINACGRAAKALHHLK